MYRQYIDIAPYRLSLSPKKKQGEYFLFKSSPQVTSWTILTCVRALAKEAMRAFD
jgi:hypothetical protein